MQHGQRELKTPKEKENRKRRDEIAREIAAAERAKRSIAARLEPLAKLADDANKLKPQRMPVHPLGNVDRFAPVMAKFVRFTIRATNNLEPCIDELEIYSAEEPSRNVALASAGAVATVSGVFRERQGIDPSIGPSQRRPLRKLPKLDLERSGPGLGADRAGRTDADRSRRMGSRSRRSL